MMTTMTMGVASHASAAAQTQARGGAATRGTGSGWKRVGVPPSPSSSKTGGGGGVTVVAAGAVAADAAGGAAARAGALTSRRRGTGQRVASTFKDDVAGAVYSDAGDDAVYPATTSATTAQSGGDAGAWAQGEGFYTDDYGIDDDDDFFQGPSGVRRTESAPSARRAPPPPASRPGSPSWATRDDGVSVTPDQRRAASGDGGGRGRGGGGYGGYDGGAGSDEDEFGGGGGEGDDRWSSAATEMRARIEAGSGAALGWVNDDIISDGGQAWFESDDDWYEPEYKEVTAPEGSILEKVQRMHLRQPKDFTFEEGEYFDLTEYVKANTDNQFCLVLEVAERARERKIEQLEALNPLPPGASLPPIQQAIVDLALEIEASGGKTSAYLAMKEAADRARLRWELQEAAWAWDNYSEEYMPELGVSERASRLLHMGVRIEDAMDFEKDLVVHEDDYNKGFTG